MKLKQLTLENFRGFKKLELALDPQLTVLVGANGAGKSSVLDVLAVMLSRITAGVRGGAGRRDVHDQDIHNGSNYMLVSAKACCSADFSWQFSKSTKWHERIKISKEMAKGLADYVKTIQQKITDTQENCSIPLFAYYPINRAVLDIPLHIQKSHDFRLLDAWDGALTSSSNFRSFFEWFRNREDLEREVREDKDKESPSFVDVISPYIDGILKIQREVDTPDRQSGQKIEIKAIIDEMLLKMNTLTNDSHSVSPTMNVSYKDSQLQAVRHAVQTFLPEFNELSVRRSPPSMIVKKHGQEVRIDQLSDGEKCLIALVADIARRLAIANPILNNPLEGEGVVLIDEVDLHLHPGWQRMVLPKLTATFPNCQFIVSTHSPQILGEVDASQIRILTQDDNNDIHCSIPQQAKGLTSNEILDELMSIPDGLETLSRNIGVEKQLDTLFRLIDDEQFEQAKTEISRLRTELHGDIPDIVRAEALMTMLGAVSEDEAV